MIQYLRELNEKYKHEAEFPIWVDLILLIVLAAALVVFMMLYYI